MPPEEQKYADIKINPKNGLRYGLNPKTNSYVPIVESAEQRKANMEQHAQKKATKPPAPASKGPGLGERLWDAANTPIDGVAGPFRFGKTSARPAQHFLIGPDRPARPEGRPLTEKISNFAGKHLPASIAGPVAGAISAPINVAEGLIDAMRPTPLGIATMGFGALPGRVGRVGLGLMGTGAGTSQASEPRRLGESVAAYSTRVLSGIATAAAGITGARIRTPVVFTKPQMVELITNAINPGEEFMPGVRTQLESQGDAVKHYARKNGIELKSSASAAKAAFGAADEARTAMSGYVEQVTDVPMSVGDLPGFQGAHIQPGSGTTTLGRMYARLVAINSTLAPKFSIGGVKGISALGAENPAVLKAEANVIRAKLYPEMGKRLGIDPAKIAEVNQRAMAAKDLGEWFQWTRDKAQTAINTAKATPVKISKGAILDEVKAKFSLPRGAYADKEIEKAFKGYAHTPTEIPKANPPSEAESIDRQALQESWRKKALDQIHEEGALPRKRVLSSKARASYEARKRATEMKKTQKLRDKFSAKRGAEQDAARAKEIAEEVERRRKDSFWNRGGGRRED